MTTKTTRKAATRRQHLLSSGAAVAACRLGVEYLPIAELKLDPRNPRLHPSKQIRQLASSIEAFGFNVPVLIDREGKVVAGHGRVLACKHLGWTEVPTIGLGHLEPAQARAFMLADNKLAENAAWDEQLLAEALRDLSLAELDFSLEATGFEMAEIDLRIESLSAPAEEGPDPADAVPPPGRPGCDPAWRPLAAGGGTGCCAAAPSRRPATPRSWRPTTGEGREGWKRPPWPSPIRPTTCRSPGTFAASAPSSTASSPWLPAG